MRDSLSHHQKQKGWMFRYFHKTGCSFGWDFVQVECKKAQPKEAVQASAQLLGKRLMLSGLGMRLPAPVTGAVTAVNPLAAVQPLAHVQAAAAAAAAAQAQSAAVAGYGKLLYPHLTGYR